MDQVVIEGGNRLIGIIEGIEVEIEVEETGGAVAKIVNVVVEGAEVEAEVGAEVDGIRMEGYNQMLVGTSNNHQHQMYRRRKSKCSINPRSNSINT